MHRHCYSRCLIGATSYFTKAESMVSFLQCSLRVMLCFVLADATDSRHPRRTLCGTEFAISEIHMVNVAKQIIMEARHAQPLTLDRVYVRLLLGHSG